MCPPEPEHHCSVMSAANLCGFTAVRVSASISATSYFICSPPLLLPLLVAGSHRVAVFLFLHSPSALSAPLAEKAYFIHPTLPTLPLTPACFFCYFSVAPVYSQVHYKSLESTECVYQTNKCFWYLSCFWNHHVCPQPIGSLVWGLTLKGDDVTQEQGEVMCRVFWILVAIKVA